MLHQISSQVGFVLALVLLVSGLTKLTIKGSFSVALATYGEIIIAIIVLFSPYFTKEHQYRVFVEQIPYIAMMCVFGIYLVLSFHGYFTKSKDSCLCFGAISKKPPRLFSLFRNMVLFILSIFTILIDQSAVNIYGFFAAIGILGAILYEEIR